MFASKESRTRHKLSNHPEIGHFYDDVETKKKGGRKKRKSAAPVNKNTNLVNIHIGNHVKPKRKGAYAKMNHVSRLATPKISFANAPRVQQASHFAVPNGVGLWHDHSVFSGVNEAHPGHLHKVMEVNNR